jgi:hypothetical protein
MGIAARIVGLLCVASWLSVAIWLLYVDGSSVVGDRNSGWQSEDDVTIEPHKLS